MMPTKMMAIFFQFHCHLAYFLESETKKFILLRWHDMVRMSDKIAEELGIK